MKSVLVNLGGEFHVADTDRLYDEPIERTVYWPTGIKIDSGNREYVGTVLDRDRSSYSIPRSGLPGIPVHLLNGGQTMMASSEEKPIECPKVRAGIATRYRNGRWEKFLK